MTFELILIYHFLIPDLGGSQECLLRDVPDSHSFQIACVIKMFVYTPNKLSWVELSWVSCEGDLVNKIGKFFNDIFSYDRPKLRAGKPKKKKGTRKNRRNKWNRNSWACRRGALDLCCCVSDWIPMVFFWIHDCNCWPFLLYVCISFYCVNVLIVLSKCIYIVCIV